ncbi:MAG: flagellar motility protein MotE (MotC chaperone) [Alteromonas naphthalenivorans]|jgi:flagellar motility protein MotE (MotC chaperone)
MINKKISSIELKNKIEIMMNTKFLSLLLLLGTVAAPTWAADGSDLPDVPSSNPAPTTEELEEECNRIFSAAEQEAAQLRNRTGDLTEGLQEAAIHMATLEYQTRDQKKLTTQQEQDKDEKDKEIEKLKKENDLLKSTFAVGILAAGLWYLIKK